VARGKERAATQAKQVIAEAKQRVRDAVIAVKAPHKMQRIKEAAIAQLGLGQLSRPVAVALGVYGAARTTYANVLGRGHDVVFPANTLIQVQLSPVASAQSQ